MKMYLQQFTIMGVVGVMVLLVGNFNLLAHEWAAPQAAARKPNPIPGNAESVGPFMHAIAPCATAKTHVD